MATPQLPINCSGLRLCATHSVNTRVGLTRKLLAVGKKLDLDCRRDVRYQISQSLMHLMLNSLIVLVF